MPFFSQQTCFSVPVMETEILAAGGVVIDHASAGLRLLLVHRPKYDDWSFPKGKLDSGETFEAAAVREVREETGLECRILRAFATITYGYRTRKKGREKPKVVHYFLMEPVSGHLRAPGEEVDRAMWFDIHQAAEKLSYEQDRRLLALI
jgi:8-oxo-dGTP pyrophosphatase MutT (NUDIX family)